MSVQNILIPASDQYPLSATLYSPDVDNSKIVLINSGTGVNRNFYGKFARFLQENGYAVISFDYRGICDTRLKTLRGFPALKQEWGSKDIAGVLEWIKTEFKPQKLFLVGHSAGGTLVGLAENNHYIDAMITVGSQNGYWGNWPFPKKYFYATMWYVIMPLTTHFMGYFPSKILGFGENLPKGVALQWAKWCRDPQYLFCEETAARKKTFQSFKAPILAYSFTDDHAAPKPAVDWLLKQFPNAIPTHKHLSPKELNVTSIGHFGLFKEKFKATLWQEINAWLGTNSPQ